MIPIVVIAARGRVAVGSGRALVRVVLSRRLQRGILHFSPCHLHVFTGSGRVIHLGEASCRRQSGRKDLVAEGGIQD